jgi:hypothetical protein
MFSGTAQVSLQVCQFFFVSSMCLLVRVTMVDKNKAVVCCFLTTSTIMLSEKKKKSVKCEVRSGIWKGIYHSMLICWMKIVPWNDAIVVSPGKLRKLWDSLSKLRRSLCERRLEWTVLRPALLSVKTVQFTQFFRHVWRHTVKSLSLTESV